MPVEVDGCRDGLMAEPAGSLRDRDAFGKRRAGERMPQIMECSVGGQPGRCDRGLPDVPVVVLTPQEGAPRGPCRNGDNPAQQRGRAARRPGSQSVGQDRKAEAD